MINMKVGTEIGPMKGSRVVLMTSMRVVSHLIDISLLTVLFHMSVDTVVKSTAEQAAMIDGEYLQIIAWRLTIKKVVERKRSPNIEIDKGFQNLEFEIKQAWHWTNMEFLYFVCGVCEQRLAYYTTEERACQRWKIYFTETMWGGR